MEPMGAVSYFQEFVVSQILGSPPDKRYVRTGTDKHSHHPSKQDTVHRNQAWPTPYTFRTGGSQ